MSVDKQNKSITLYYHEGSSDKVYQCWVEKASQGTFTVRFAFGRRGATLQTGTKTTAPVDLQTAMKVYDKLIESKMAKGYTPGEDGTPYAGTERQALATGVFPQLLNPIDEDQALKLIGDDAWWMQEKYDGKRILIRKIGQEITGINRKGLAVALPQPLVAQALTIGGAEQWLIDGEAVGDAYFAFDLLERWNTDLRQASYADRLATLSGLLEPGGKGPIRLVETACTRAAKRELLAELRRGNREGAVFKRASSPYVPGRPASGGDQLKLKFTATASCLVAKVNGTRRSVALELLDGGKRVGVGNVTIPANKAMPKPQDILEIRYLYAFPGGSLFQPVYIGLRDDVGQEACTVSQLKLKAEDPDSTEES